MWIVTLSQIQIYLTVAFVSRLLFVLWTLKFARVLMRVYSEEDDYENIAFVIELWQSGCFKDPLSIKIVLLRLHEVMPLVVLRLNDDWCVLFLYSYDKLYLAMLIHFALSPLYLDCHTDTQPADLLLSELWSLVFKLFIKAYGIWLGVQS